MPTEPFNPSQPQKAADYRTAFVCFESDLRSQIARTLYDHTGGEPFTFADPIVVEFEGGYFSKSIVGIAASVADLKPDFESDELNDEQEPVLYYFDELTLEQLFLVLEEVEKTLANA